MNVWDKLAAGAYQTQLTHPQPPRLGDGKKQADRTAYYEARRAYRADVDRLEALLKHDLAEYHGVLGHPKLERLTQIAWDERHAHGLNEFANFFSELVELIK